MCKTRNHSNPELQFDLFWVPQTLAGIASFWDSLMEFGTLVESTFATILVEGSMEIWINEEDSSVISPQKMNYVPLEPQWPLSLKANPPKNKAKIPIKTAGSFGFKMVPGCIEEVSPDYANDRPVEGLHSV